MLCQWQSITYLATKKVSFSHNFHIPRTISIFLSYQVASPSTGALRAARVERFSLGLS